MEESEIIQGCIDGDRKCQHILYKKFYGKMLGVCMRYSKDRDEARDVLQDGFIKVFNKLGQYSGDGSFEGWVRRVITNIALDKIRRTKTSIRYVSDSLIEESGEENTDVNTSREYIDEAEDCLGLNKEDIMSAVQQLPPMYRTVFNMHIVDGVPHQEIANRLGINIGTSKSNLAKAKMVLRKKLNIHLQLNTQYEQTGV